MARTAAIDPSIWEAALVGLEAQRAKLDDQIAVVRAQLGKGKPGRKAASPTSTDEVAPARKRKPLSAAARKRIAAAQKKRWAAVRKARAAQ